MADEAPILIGKTRLDYGADRRRIQYRGSNASAMRSKIERLIG